MEQQIQKISKSEELGSYDAFNGPLNVKNLIEHHFISQSDKFPIFFDRSGTIRNVGGSDMGNVGAVMPVIQPYSSGLEGWGHYPNCKVKYPEYAVFDPAVVQAAIACVLLENGGRRGKKIVEDYHPVFPSIAEYCAVMEDMCRKRTPVTYDEHGVPCLKWD